MNFLNWCNKLTCVKQTILDSLQLTTPVCTSSENLSIKNRRREKGCTRPMASESRGELMRFAGKSGSPRCNRAAPIIDTMDHRWAHFSLSPLMNGANPCSPTSLALARGNFSFVHETVWSEAVYLMSLGSVVTRRRDAPILWTQMSHFSSYVINRNA